MRGESSEEQGDAPNRFPPAQTRLDELLRLVSGAAVHGGPAGDGSWGPADRPPTVLFC